MSALLLYRGTHIWMYQKSGSLIQTSFVPQLSIAVDVFIRECLIQSSMLPRTSQ